MHGHIDLHAHVLPEIDDGPESEGAAFAIVEVAQRAGTVEMVATPHVNERHYLEPERVMEVVAGFNARLATVGLDVILHPGAEIALPRLVDLTDTQLELLVLGAGRHLLLESPLADSAGDFEGLIHSAMARGFGVLLAHPERCPTFQRSPERLARLVKLGVQTQITAGSILGNFGSVAQRFTRRMLRDDLVHVIASDTHDATRRAPGLGVAVAAAVAAVPALAGREAWMTHDVPAAILSGRPIPEVDPLPETRFGRARLSLVGWGSRGA